MRRILRLVCVTTAITSLSCQSKTASSPPPMTPAVTPAPATEPPVASSPSVPYPRVEIHFTDHTADEGAWSTTVLFADGAFESEHEMSDGGATSTVTQCTGRLDAAKADNWLSRMHADATLQTEPGVPSFSEALAKNIRGSYRIHYFESETTSAWVDPTRWEEARVRPLLDHMGETMTCTTSKR